MLLSHNVSNFHSLRHCLDIERLMLRGNAFWCFDGRCGCRAFSVTTAPKSFTNTSVERPWASFAFVPNGRDAHRKSSRDPRMGGFTWFYRPLPCFTWNFELLWNQITSESMLRCWGCSFYRKQSSEWCFRCKKNFSGRDIWGTTWLQTTTQTGCNGSWTSLRPNCGLNSPWRSADVSSTALESDGELLERQGTGVEKDKKP